MNLNAVDKRLRGYPEEATLPDGLRRRARCRGRCEARRTDLNGKV